MLGLTIPASLVLACIVVVVAAAWDLKTRTIPNALTYGALILGLATALVAGSFGSSLLGVAVAGGSGLVLYALRAMGGGDVKLLAAIGSLLGYPLTMDLLFFSVLFGGAWAIFALCWQGAMLRTLKELWLLVRSLIYPKIPLFVPAQGVHIAGGAVIAAATLWITVSMAVGASALV